ncbi:MAG: OmpH family outer membrane protein [Spirochaetia bacterium]|nr:OmpH family outer membrane protein [Spirochaetia bacterium]
MKRISLRICITALVLMLGSASQAFSQQITRVAVLDIGRVLTYYSKEAAALSNFEKKKAEVQAEVDKRSAEIKLLQAKKTDAQSKSDTELAASLELEDYLTARQNELDLLAKALSSSSSFLQRLNSAIAKVAEAEGYSLVLNMKPQDQNANLVLWNSPSIDITDKVIQALAVK